MLENDLEDGNPIKIEQYLTFSLGQDNYAFDILQVKEIRGWTSVARLPNAPAFIKGVMNLRGEIVPVIDLRIRFGMEPKPYGPMTVVIVVQVNSSHRKKNMAIVVDEVSEVFELLDKTIGLKNEFSKNPHKDYIDGIVEINNKNVVLLNINKLLDLNQYSYKKVDKKTYI